MTEEPQAQPYVPPKDNSGSASKDTGWEPLEFKGLKKVSERGLRNPKTVFVGLAVIIGSIATFSVCRQRANDEESFRHLIQSAQQAEDSSRYEDTAYLRSAALAIAKRLFKPPKSLADLDMQIERAWANDQRERFAKAAPIHDASFETIGDKASVVYQTDQLREPRIREALTLYSPNAADRTAEIDEARWELAEILTQHSLTIEAHKAFLCPGECSSKLATSAAKARSQALNGISNGHMLAPRDAYLHQNSSSFFDTEHKLDCNLRYAGHDPESLPDTIDLAQKAATAGDFEGALVEYSRALGLRQSEDLRAKWIQSKNAIASGDLYNDKRDYNEALALLLKLQKTPGYAKPESENYLRISFAIADVLTLLHRYDEAEHEIDALVSQQHHPPQAYAGRGIILAEQGKFDEAVNSLKQALSLPGAQGAEINQALANIYISTGHFQEAEHLLK